MTVMAYKMISGEEIMAEVVEAESSVIRLKNPAMIIFQDDGMGKLSMRFAPLAPYAKNNEVSMQTSAIAFMIEVDRKLEKEYNRIFGTGIQIASATDLPR